MNTSSVGLRESTHLIVTVTRVLTETSVVDRRIGYDE